MLVSDATLGLENLPQPGWRKKLIMAWANWYAQKELQLARKSLTIVNSKMLFDSLREKVEDLKLSMMPLSIYYHPEDTEVHGKADIVFFETANGGAMFSTGSITWMSSTPENNFDNDVARITLNVINRFMDPTPFPAIAEEEVDDVDRLPANPEYEHADQQ